MNLRFTSLNFAQLRVITGKSQLKFCPYVPYNPRKTFTNRLLDRFFKLKIFFY
jgi:hypothetical protein